MLGKITTSVKSKLNRPSEVLASNARLGNTLLFVVVPVLIFVGRLKSNSHITFSDQSLFSFCNVSATTSGVFLALSIAFAIFLWQSSSQVYRDSIVRIREYAKKIRENISGKEDVLGERAKTLAKLCSNIEAITETGFMGIKRVRRHLNLIGEFFDKSIESLSDKPEGEEFTEHNVLVLVRENLALLASLFRGFVARELTAKILSPWLFGSLGGFLAALLLALLGLVLGNLSEPNIHLPNYMNFTWVIIIMYLIAVSAIQLILVVGFRFAFWKIVD